MTQIRVDQGVSAYILPHWQAINTDTAECFAVKEVLLYGSDSQNSQRLAMLEREIAIMGQLQVCLSFFLIPY